VSVFLVTAISAAIFPYRKRARGIWESSPYSRWKFLGVPVVTIAGIVYLVYVAILLYYAFISEKTRDLTGKNLIIFVAIWVVGILWYVFWKSRSRRQDINIDIAFKELPPE